MSISSRIESIEGHIGDIYDTLELGGSDLTNVDKNIVNINSELMGRYKDYLANGTDELWNNWDNTSVTGVNEATLNNTIKGKMAIIPKGDTQQFTTTGKNLLNVPSELTVTGQTNKLISLEAGTYILSASSIQTSGQYVSLFLFYYEDDSVLLAPLGSNTLNATITATKKIKSVNIYSQDGYAHSQGVTATFNNLMIRNSSITDNSYEPYTAGASPNPSYPQEINNVTGDVEVKVQNKNLFDGTDIELNKTLNTSTGATSNSDTWYVTNYIKIEGINTLYKSSYDRTKGQLNCFYNKNKEFISSINQLNGIINVPAGSYYMRTEGLITELNDNLQIEQGSTASNYIPHQEQNYPISLGDIELCKIGMAQDYIYKQNGNWYKYGAIGKIVLDGSENWTMGLTSRFILNVGKLSSSNTGYCDLFKTQALGKTNGITFLINTQNIYIQYNEKTNVTDFTTWLSTHNTTVYYVLATPVITQITDTTLINQLNALEQAYGYNEQTNISQEANIPFVLDVTALTELS